MVIGLIAILGSLGLAASMDSYRGYGFRNERDIIVGALQKARSQAMSNMCFGGCTDGKPHGVSVQAQQYTIFQGLTYASRNSGYDETVPAASNGMQLNGLSEIVFSQLSGHVANPGTITISDQAGRASLVTINSEGQITWTN